MDRFMEELREIKKMRSSLRASNSAQENSSEKRAKTQRLSVEIKVEVKEEVRVEETHLKDPIDHTEKERSPQHEKTTQKKNLASTMRSRSRSCDRSQRYKTPRSRHEKWRRRDYSTDRVDRRRSRSHSKRRRRRSYSSGREDTRRSRSGSRRRHNYSSDREDRRRSRSRGRRRHGRRRSVTPYRRTHRVESGRSRSRSRGRMDDTRRSCHSSPSDRNSNRSKNDRNSESESPSGLNEPPKICATDYEVGSNVTDQKREQKFSSTSSRTTIEILRSRIQSTLKKAAGYTPPSSTVTSTKISQEEYRSNMTETQETQNTMFDGNDICSKESIQSRFEADIDESIFNKIVSTATSSVAKYSNSNVDIPPAFDLNDAMQYTNPHVFNTQSSPFPVAQIPNYQTCYDQIKDPRIRKMIQAQAALSYQHQLHEKHTLGSEKMNEQWGNCSGPSEKKSPITYGEYKKQQARTSSSGNNDKAKVSGLIRTSKAKVPELPPIPKGKASELISTSNEQELIPTPKANVSESITTSKLSESVPSPEENLKAENGKETLKPKNKKTRKGTTEKHAVAHKKRKTSKIKSVDTKTRKKATKEQAAVHEKGQHHQYSVICDEQSSVTKLKQDVNATVNEETSSSSNQAFSALKKIVNPQHLLTLLDVMKQMTENNSLDQVKEALKTCSAKEDPTLIEKYIQPNQEQLNAATTEPAGNPYQTKIKKNELDRLHEDINNMFIRDGVLNASGRRRCGSTTNTSSSLRAVVDAFDAKRKTENPSSASRKKKSGKIKKRVRPSTTTTVNVKKMSSCGVAPVVLLTRLDPAMKIPRVKNNNPEWHSLKAVLSCLICKDPPGISLISHYVNFHPDDEVVNSRLSPEAAQRLRSTTDFPQCEEIRSTGSLVYRQFCYFCNTKFSLPRQSWISHMIRHTGYFDYKCNGCSWKFSTKALYHACGSPNSVIEKIHQPIFQANIMAYVCDLCNYVRFHEEEMQMHLNNEHEVDEIKDYKEFKFFTLPLGKKIGRPRKVDVHNEAN